MEYISRLYSMFPCAYLGWLWAATSRSQTSVCDCSGWWTSMFNDSQVSLPTLGEARKLHIQFRVKYVYWFFFILKVRICCLKHLHLGGGIKPPTFQQTKWKLTAPHWGILNHHGYIPGSMGGGYALMHKANNLPAESLTWKELKGRQ